MYTFFGLAIFVFAFVQAAKRPSYITPCNITATNLNQCAVTNGRLALPFIIKGDNKYKIPNMLPLKIPKIDFKTGDLSIDLKNVEIFGFTGARLEDMSIDVKKQHIEAIVSIENATLHGDYVIDGKILIIPLKGKGPCRISFVGGVYTYKFDFDIIEKNNEQYLNIAKSGLTYTTTRSYYNFENLLTGQQSLGININDFLNDNWKEIQNDFGPALTEIIDMIMTTSLTGIFSRVPYKSLFLE